MIKKDIKNKYEKGQTLLFVVVAVTIALSIGVAVSTRTINSLRRVSRTDTSTRVIAAAEGGIENLLGRTYSELDDAMTPSESTCSQVGASYDPSINSCIYVFSGEYVPVEEDEIPPSECTVDRVYISDCGGGSCLPTQRQRTTTYLEPGCDPKFICINDSGCAIPLPPFDDSCLVPPGCDGCNVQPGQCGVGGCLPREQYVRIRYFPLGCHPDDFDCRDNPECGPQPGPLVMGASDSVDLITSRAVVSVAKFNSNEDNGGYSFNLEPGDLREVYLEGYTSNQIKVCIQNTNSAIYYISYNSQGELSKGGFYPSDFSYDPVNNISNFDGASLSDDGYCIEDVSLVDNSYGLRIKILYEPSRVVVYPSGTSSEFPDQGYVLTSKGEIISGEESQEQATVIVHKTYPHASDIFDYGIYTPSGL